MLVDPSQCKSIRIDPCRSDPSLSGSIRVVPIPGLSESEGQVNPSPSCLSQSKSIRVQRNLDPSPEGPGSTRGGGTGGRWGLGGVARR